jgi:hypothetical protein
MFLIQLNNGNDLLEKPAQQLLKRGSLKNWPKQAAKISL